MDQVTFRKSVLIASSLITLAFAFPPVDEDNVSASRAPSPEAHPPHLTVPVAETHPAGVNISAGSTSIPVNTSLKMENTEANIQKHVSFSPEVSDEIEAENKSASSSTYRENLDDTSESASAASPEDFSAILRRDTSFEPADKLEEEFVEFFDNELPGAERTTSWEAMRIVYLNSAEEMWKICQSVYDVWCRSTCPPVVNFQTLTYELRVSTLDVGPRGAKSFWVDVLKCARENTDHVHVTKGRRPNSVYFVEPAVVWHREEDFVFDRTFESDIDLRYDFESAVHSILEKQQSNIVSSSRRPGDLQSPRENNPEHSLAEEQPSRVSDKIPASTNHHVIDNSQQDSSSALPNFLPITGESLKLAQSVN